MISQTDQRSRESSGRILQVAEREIGRIILDIHDGPVQNIFAALSQLYITKRRLTQSMGDEATDELERISRSIFLLENSLNEIRMFMGTFRPPEFERRDLIAVLEGLVIQHEEITGKSVSLDVYGDLPEVGLSVKISLYRILQEALSNAARHGQARRHNVVIAAESDQLVMDVTDDGCGFDVETVLMGKHGVHIGLEGMRERVSVLGGRFEIKSTPGMGTQVRVMVPLQ